MQITLEAALALFVLLATSSATFFLSKKIRIPYTVLLVAVGVLLVPLSKFEAFSFIKEFTLTPELLFYIFLPILIFESAYNMNIRRMVENATSIGALAIISLIISTFLSATLLYFIFGFIGLQIPFIVTLLFGALISATDPVAVLSLFKEYGAPRRLSLIFEGESLFNDGTAVALFLVILSIATNGFGGAESVTSGIFSFLTMVCGGTIFGLLMGGIFSKIVGYTKNSEFVSITMMIVLAHLTFILTEIISEYAKIGNSDIILSPIIATTVAAIVIGNYGRHKISPHAEEFIEKFWGQFAFIANSLVFILIGLLFVSLNVPFSVLIVPIIIAILVVALARAVSIYPVVAFLNWLKIEEPIPATWQHLLSWGSLRGALAIIMVLLIPEDLTIANWSYSFSVQDFIMALTIGCIYATLFIKATTIGGIIKKLKIDELNEIEKVEKEESLAIIHARVLSRLFDFWNKGYIDEKTYKSLHEKHEEGFRKACEGCGAFDEKSASISNRVMRIYAIGIEKHFLKELYAYGEVSERVYKKISGKLAIQLEKVEHGRFDIDLSTYRDRKDVLDNLSDTIVGFIFPKTREETIEDAYMYYRAQSIISRKVVKELTKTVNTYKIKIFNEASLNETIATYTKYQENSGKKASAIQESHEDIIVRLNEELADRGVFKIEESVLNDLMKKEMITPKLYITLKDQFEKEAVKY